MLNSAAATSTWPRAGLRSQGKGYYTIGSSGHEGNAAVAAALRPTDPALLHYRSGGFLPGPRRAGRRPRPAARRAAWAGGGHRGTDRRWAAQGVRPPRPQHHSADVDHRVAPSACRRRRVLRRARQRSSGVACPWPDDAVTVCSFGDASVNHSTAVGAINAALHSAYQGVPDAAAVRVRGQRDRHQRQDAARVDRARPTETVTGCAYFDADGCDRGGDVRRRDPRRGRGYAPHRRPAFLHLRMVRLMGHAGSDYEPAYRTPTRLPPTSTADPVLCTAQSVDRRWCADTPSRCSSRYEAKRANVIELAR